MSALKASPIFPKSVYVHVPFCLHHCGYCDFSVIANRDSLIPDYLKALRNEFNSAKTVDGQYPDPQIVETVFIGGGTPTHLSADQLAELLQLIKNNFQLSPDGEFSVEANPDGLCDQKLEVLCSSGVNRLSLGVQSFDDVCLKTLERRHTAADAVDTIHRCSRTFSNLSVDLIFAVPGQSVRSWQETLRTAVSLPLQHLSTYGLTYEQGTPFFRREKQGQLLRLPDDDERTMYLDAVTEISNGGFEHYEVSNFARPGFRCRHNQTYWQADSYFAFGPGAARYTNGIRSTNSRSVIRWLRAWLDGSPCVEESEELSAEDKAREALMLALRMIDGLNLSEFEDRFGFGVESLAPDALRRHLDSGLLNLNNDRLRLTREGLLLADSVVVDFL